jgi:hypothetical protein
MTKSIEIKHEDYFTIEKTLEKLENNNNEAILSPFLLTMQDNLKDVFNKDIVPTDKVFLKDIYILLGKLSNEYNKEIVLDTQVILKKYLLSYTIEKNNSYNTALEMSFYDQGVFDHVKGVEEIDYPLLVNSDCISSWLAGWHDYKNKS